MSGERTPEPATTDAPGTPGTADALEARLRRLHRGIGPAADFDARLAARIAREQASIGRAADTRAADRGRLDREHADRLRRLRREASTRIAGWIGAGVGIAAAAWTIVPALVAQAGGGVPAVEAFGVPLAAWIAAGAAAVGGAWFAGRAR